MNDTEITKLEHDLSLVQRAVKSDEENLSASERPSIEKVFLASSSKLLHDLQRKLCEAKAERAYELIRFRLIGNQMDGSIPLKTLVKLITPLNQLLERCSWRAWDKEGDSKKIDDRFSGLLDLRLQGISTGSTELAILGNTSPDLTGYSALEGGLKNIFFLLKAENDEFTNHINDIGIDAAKSLSELMSELEKHAIAIELWWNSPNGYLYWEGRPADISRVKSILEDIGEPETKLITIRGKIQVLSIRNRLEILIEDQEPHQKIVVTYHHSMVEEIQELRLGDRRDFLIEKTTYPLSMSRKKKNAYRLKKIQFVDLTKKPDDV